jgi:hypothetical protein
MFNHKCRFVLAFFWLLLLPSIAEAQTAASALLTPPQTEEFPKVSTTLEVYDGEGDFVHNLQARNITIIEDDQSVSISELSELETGAQFVVALNLGPTFAIRDVNGISRYDNLREALSVWADQHTAPLDDLSFLTNDGLENLHLSNALQWQASLSGYGTDPRSATPSLDVLLRAINVASDPSPRTGMGRSVLFLTPPPDRAGTAAIQSLSSIARQERVRVHVWLVSSPAYFTSEGANQLAELAAQTGGQFFTFSGEEEIPNVEDYLEPLRNIYTLAYQSQIRNSQPHQISARIQANGLSVTSNVQEFDLQVLPPNPIFISPPLQIFRANRAALEDAFTEENDYTPKEQSLEILVEFPDGRPRPLVRTTLYVDGMIAAENTSPPFGQFIWDLSAYAASGTHALQVEALDSFGLSSISIETAVQITIQQSPQSIVATIARNGPLIAGLTVALAGGILLLVLVIGGRIGPRRFGRQREKAKSSSKQEKEDKSDPVTQPVRIAPLQTKKHSSGWRNRFSRTSRQSESPKTFAYLDALDQSNGISFEHPIPISNTGITLGKDPTMATIAFKDSSVENLHARIHPYNDDDGFLITDEGSIAGTWVNFTQISSGGKKLAHGDIIHIGRIGLRFMVSDKKQIPQLKIIHQEPLS